MYDATVWTIGTWGGRDQFGCSGFIIAQEIPHIAARRVWGIYATRAEALVACDKYAKQYKTYAVNDTHTLYADYRQ